MFRFYSILNDRRPEGCITQEEIDIASGKQSLSAEMAAKFLNGLEAQSQSIKIAFAKQHEQAVVCLFFLSSQGVYNVLIHYL